jgi:hypothetical protein
MRFVPAVLLLLMVGCSHAIVVTPPAERNITKQRTFEKSYDFIWSRAVAWFAGNNVVIEKIEKNSGLITAKYLLRLDDGFLDPGKIETSGYGWSSKDLDIKHYASINILVRNDGPEKTTVSVNIFGHFDAEGYYGLIEKMGPVKASGNSVSTGKLEASVFNFLAKHD